MSLNSPTSATSLTPPTNTHSKAELLQLDAKYVWHPFTQAQTAPEPLLVQRAQGVTLELGGGIKLLDMISSWWVNLHGHGHPAIAAAIAEQARQLEHVIFAGFSHQPAIQLAATLAEALPDPLERIFFTDNGSTATEAAIKMCLQYWHNASQPRQRVLALEGGYHGDTFGAMSAGRSSGFYGPFESLLFEVNTLPCPHSFMNDSQQADKEQQSLELLDSYLAQYGQQTAALILEPLLQGASGMRVYSAEFLQQVIARVRQHGILVIFDEVLTGFFRTGKLWAAEHVAPEYAPDLLCLSKGITGGFMPLGVTACSQEIYEGFLGHSFERAFAHGHSYTASPLACAAALASWQLLHSTETQENLQRIAEQHKAAAHHWSDLPKLEHVRQLGTLLAVDLKADEATAEAAEQYGSTNSLALREYFAERGLLLRPLGNTCYLLPPYCVTDEQLERAYTAITELGSGEAQV